MNNVSIAFGLIALCCTHQTFAEKLSLGDSEDNLGELVVSGAVRAAYLHQNFADQQLESSSNGKVKFLDFKLILDYENPHFIGSMEARCYQYDRLCDAIFVRDAWIGYKISDQSQIAIGQQDVEFGFGRLWGNTSYGSIFSLTGLENVQNIGIKYKVEQNNYDFTLGYYPRDGLNYKGMSLDSSRYAASFVEADVIELGTDIEEKNMWITRFSKHFPFDENQNFRSELGVSYWYSDLDNTLSDKEGQRNTWSIFNTLNYRNWEYLLLLGKQEADNKDLKYPHYSTMGSFDGSYQVANDSKFMLTELNYSIKNPFKNTEEIKPYISYGRYFKDEPGYLDTERMNMGFYSIHHHIGVHAEYVISKNDPLLGGGSNAIAEGKIVSSTNYLLSQ